MRNNINILNNDKVFSYVIEYITYNSYTDGLDINWCMNNDVIYLLEGDIKYYRNKNDWYNASDLNLTHDNIPKAANISKIRVYLPNHSISTYIKNIKYAITLNTWINGYKIDLGSLIFKPNDAIANEFGPIKYGNNEYHEYFEFDILDPFDIMYSDNWIDFRNKVCKEPLGINNTGSLLNVSLYVVDEYDNRYMIKDGVTGGMTAFNISNIDDIMSLQLTTTVDDISAGLQYHITINKTYNWLLTYLKETYGIVAAHNNMYFELVIKNKDTVIIGPTIKYYDVVEDYGNIVKNVRYDNLITNVNFKTFFDSWDSYEEGWNLVGSFSIDADDGDGELFTLVSNEIPITQEVFNMFTNNGSNKIIDLNNMNIIKYNVINKIENQIVQIERPNDSKSNIIQPVFFKVNDLELLTLHPNVTENVCINLDDYKSKVEKFILQIDACKFEQIGANKYGIIFKIPANKLTADVISGTYYILNEDSELVTTGKYNCIR